MAVFITSCSQTTSPDHKNGKQGDDSMLPWLSTSGHKIVDDTGQQVILHGVNRSGLEYDRIGGNRINKQEIDHICNEWQAKIIRLPFNQEWMTNNVIYQQKIDEIIGWIKKHGVYILLDLQWENESVKIPAIPNEQAITMWRDIAFRYKDEPAVLYDIHNEAHDIDFNSWRNRAVQIIESIQEVHPKALILVSGLNWASDISMWASNPLDHQNIVYSVHVYPNWGGSSTWDRRFGNFSQNIPIFCGEFGGEDQDIQWGKDLIRYLYQHRLGWCAWSWVDWPHLTDRDDHLTPTPFGSLVKSYLQRFSLLDSLQNQIINLRFSFVEATRATITWETEWESDSKVLYGTSSAYTDSIYAAALLKNHMIKLDNLQPGTTYHLQAISADELGITISSRDTLFITLTQ